MKTYSFSPRPRLFLRPLRPLAVTVTTLQLRTSPQSLNLLFASVLLSFVHHCCCCLFDARSLFRTLASLLLSIGLSSAGGIPPRGDSDRFATGCSQPAPCKAACTSSTTSFFAGFLFLDVRQHHHGLSDIQLPRPSRLCRLARCRFPPPALRVCGSDKVDAVGLRSIAVLVGSSREQLGCDASLVGRTLFLQKIRKVLRGKSAQRLLRVGLVIIRYASCFCRLVIVHCCLGWRGRRITQDVRCCTPVPLKLRSSKRT